MNLELQGNFLSWSAYLMTDNPDAGEDEALEPPTERC